MDYISTPPHKLCYTSDYHFYKRVMVNNRFELFVIKIIFKIDDIFKYKY